MVCQIAIAAPSLAADDAPRAASEATPPHTVRSGCIGTAFELSGGFCHARARDCARGRCAMKIFNFHLMPYVHADLDAIERNGSAWITYSNAHYDPIKGAELYHRFLDEL